MKKIGILIPNLYNGGAERAAGLLSARLSKIYDVYILIQDSTQVMYEYGGTIVPCGEDGWDYYEYYVDLHKKQLKLECTISFLEPFNFVNIRTRQVGEKIIISERNVQSQFNPPYYYENYFVRKLYGYADKIVAVSKGVREDLIKNYGISAKLITTIYNFAEKERICDKVNDKSESGQESKSIWKFLGNSPYFINVGRLETQKNQKKLIVQFANLVKHVHDVKLLIIGSGPLMDELNSLISRLHMEGKIRVASRTHNPFIYMKNAYGFVMSSDYEGLPNVLIESMILGIPIIAVDCISGPRELLADNFDYGARLTQNSYTDRGILVPNFHSDSEGTSMYLAEAMLYMLKNKEYRISVIKNAKKYIDKYDNDELTDKWISVIEEKADADKNKKYFNIPKRVSIYGAGSIGRRLVHQLLRENIKIDYIIVSNTDGNPQSIEEIEIVSLDSVLDKANKIDLLLGVGNAYRNEVIRAIGDIEFHSIELPRLVLE